MCDTLTTGTHISPDAPVCRYNSEVFHLIMSTLKERRKSQNWLYLLVPENELAHAKTGSKPWRGWIGMTLGNRKYHKQSYKLKLIKCKIDISGHTDKEVHDKMRSRPESILKNIESHLLAGEHNHGSDELFEFYCTLDEAYALICECAIEVKKTKLDRTILKDQATFNAYPYQESFKVKFCAHTGNYFLLAMKCRSGKTASSYYAMQSMGYQKVLVISYYSSPIDGWESDAITFNFGRTPIMANNVTNPSWDRQVASCLESGEHFALIATAQFFADERKNLSRLTEVIDKFDCIILDECHYGGTSVSLNKFLENYPGTRTLEVSATPFRAFVECDPNDVFIHSYADEQRAKKNGEAWAQDKPKMKLITKIYNSQSAHAAYPEYTSDRIGCTFSLNAPKVEDATDFLDVTCVEEFVKDLFDRDNRNRHEYALYYSKHIVASMPSNLSCVLFAEVLKRMNVEYVPLVINDGKTKTRDIINHCKKHEKTICLTFMGNVCGVTNSYWDTALFLHDYPSAQNWIQFAFRSGSVRKRNFFTVIDFAPTRSIRSLYDMIAIGQSDEDIADGVSVIRTMTDIIDMNAFHEKCVKWTQDDIINLLAKDPENLGNNLGSLKVNVDMDDNQALNNILQILSGLQSSNFVSGFEDAVISDNETFNKSNVKIERNGSHPSTKSLEKELENMVREMKRSIVNAAFVAELDDHNSSNLHSLLEYPNLNEVLDITPNDMLNLIERDKLFGPNGLRVLNVDLSEVSMGIRKIISNSQTCADCEGMLKLTDRLFHAQKHRPLPNSLISQFHECLAE